MWDPYAEFQKINLDNGLTVHVATWENRPWEYMGFIIHSGAREDPAGQEGTAHFVEHVVGNNVNGITMIEMAEFFEALGGYINFATGYLGTEYDFFCPADLEALKKSISICGKMLLAAQLSNEVENQRNVILREFKKINTLDDFYEIKRKRREILFSGNSLSRYVTPLGSPESLGVITENNLQEFYNRYYTPINISVVAVGGLTSNEVIALLKDSPFAARNAGIRNTMPEKIAIPDLPVKNYLENKFSDFLRQSVSCGAYLVEVILPGIINDYALRILKRMLYDFLYEEIREKKSWVYELEVESISYQSLKELRIHIPNFSPDYLDPIKNIVDDALNHLGTNLTLFNKVKSNLISRLRMIDISAKELFRDALNYLAEEPKVISLQEKIEGIQEITLKDINDLLIQNCPQERRLISVLIP